MGDEIKGIVPQIDQSANIKGNSHFMRQKIDNYKLVG